MLSIYDILDYYNYEEVITISYYRRDECHTAKLNQHLFLDSEINFVCPYVYRLQLSNSLYLYVIYTNKIQKLYYINAPIQPYVILAGNELHLYSAYMESYSNVASEWLIHLDTFDLEVKPIFIYDTCSMFLSTQLEDLLNDSSKIADIDDFDYKGKQWKY